MVAGMSTVTIRGRSGSLPFSASVSNHDPSSSVGGFPIASSFAAGRPSGVSPVSRFRVEDPMVRSMPPASSTTRNVLMKWMPCIAASSFSGAVKPYATSVSTPSRFGIFHWVMSVAPGRPAFACSRRTWGHSCLDTCRIRVAVVTAPARPTGCTQQNQHTAPPATWVLPSPNPAGTMTSCTSGATSCSSTSACFDHTVSMRTSS
jgi:hypothetical protein